MLKGKLDLFFLITFSIREYASTPYIGKTQSSHWLIQGSSPHYFFSASPIMMKISLPQDIIFLTFIQNFKSLPHKTTEIRPFTILAFSSGLFIHHLLLLLHHKTKFLRSISPNRCNIESWNMCQNVWFDGLQCTVTMTRGQRA